jgi:hypothetical protein
MTIGQMQTRKRTIVYAIMIILIGLILFFSSCGSPSSKSGQRIANPLEKVVIIDSRPLPLTHDMTQLYEYKVKRINHGVVTFIYDPGKFEANDTIYHRF